ncbi:flagellar basal body-associated FliL family protein [Parvularcula dongshanensis]|uniref:Flagellar protein FliL n=1 Tax=Parvularcula dongshanensis TaxID=1173995 RepID=A0A840I5S6_9PROT|nr:flagellar basal body-associated FliL family protein [Parvularcula dongshanensis]MBB4659623.1 flagellar FliL protein [Parvularcula dongshanensis]
MAEGKKGGALGIAALALIAGGGTFAMVKIASSGLAPSCAAEAGPIAAEEHHDVPAAAYVALEPVVVSLRPGIGARSLRIGIALGMTDDHAALEEAQVLRLKDGFLGDLRAVTPDTVSDPEALPALREQLLHRARSVLGPGAVAEILITDFMMT